MNANFYVGCILPWFSDSNTPCACAPGHTLASHYWGVNRWAAAIVFPGLAISSNSCCHFHGKGRSSESPGAQCVGLRAPDWAGRFCSFDGRHKQWVPYEDYKIITAILTPRAPCLRGCGGEGAESPIWPLVSSIIWLHILATGAHPLRRPNLNRILSGARRGSLGFRKNEQFKTGRFLTT